MPGFEVAVAATLSKLSTMNQSAVMIEAMMRSSYILSSSLMNPIEYCYNLSQDGVFFFCFVRGSLNIIRRLLAASEKSVLIKTH